MQTILAVLRWLAARLLHHHTFNRLDEMCATFNSIQISNFSSSKFSFTRKTSFNFHLSHTTKNMNQKKLPNSPWLEMIFVRQGHLHFMPTSIMSKNDRLTQLIGRKHQHRLCTFHNSAVGFVEILRWTKKPRLVVKKESFLRNNSRSEKIAKSWDVVFWMSPLSNLASWSSHSSLTIVRCFIIHSRSSIPTITPKSAAVIVIDTLLFGGNLFGKNGSFSTSLFASFSRIQLAFGSSPVYPPEVEHSFLKSNLPNRKLVFQPPFFKG